jgi:hypothetical protein
MGCELEVAVVGDDEERSKRLLGLIAERADGSEDVTGGSLFTFLSADCPEVEQSLSTLLYRHDADWRDYLSF